VFALMLASLAFGEFLPRRRKTLLVSALEGTASLYTYFASTAVILLLVVRQPPNSRFGSRVPPPDATPLS
jgi:hypothetical protein